MKWIKWIPCLVVTIAFLACGEVKTQDEPRSTEQTDNASDVEAIRQLFRKSMQDVEPVKYHEIRDSENGMVMARFPIPESWKVNSRHEPVYMEGPEELKVYKTETEEFWWSNDPMMQQTLQMSGKMLAPPMDCQQILEQFVRPNAESQGYKFVRSYALPEVTGFWQRFFRAMVNTGSRREVESLGTEWTAPNGNKTMIILLRNQILQQQALFWQVQTTELEASSDYFDEARIAYLYSAANAKINPEWIRYKNGQLIGNIQRSNEFWSRASAQSAAAHQQRMNAIAARGNAALSIGKTYSDILDISHKGYLNRSNINDAGHQRTVRAINETALIGNHETGEHYEVPSGSKYYWVSQDGVYIGTDNPLLNPNTDDRLNDKDWEKFAVEH